MRIDKDELIEIINKVPFDYISFAKIDFQNYEVTENNDKCVLIINDN